MLEVRTSVSIIHSSHSLYTPAGRFCDKTCFKVWLLGSQQDVVDRDNNCAPTKTIN